MDETELKDQVIKEFVNLQRIKAAEIEYQENILRVRMQALGIPTDNLELK